VLGPLPSICLTLGPGPALGVFERGYRTKPSRPGGPTPNTYVGNSLIGSIVFSPVSIQLPSAFATHVPFRRAAATPFLRESAIDSHACEAASDQLINDRRSRASARASGRWPSDRLFCSCSRSSYTEVKHSPKPLSP
jgi:hypothetical protein